MTERIGLMGLGRIGKDLIRVLVGRSDVEVAAVADAADPEALAYLLRFDTLRGRFPGEVAWRDGALSIAGRTVRLVAAKSPGEVDWAALGVDTVIEAEANRRGRADCERHLEKGAARVILCAPPTDAPDVTIVPGFNEAALGPQHRIVSASGPTVHAAAPVLKTLADAFGLTRAFLSTVHAYTAQQHLADTPAPDARRGRAAAENIVPQAADTAADVIAVLPALAGKLTSHSMNVPVANGSVVDLVCWHERKVTAGEVNAAVASAARGPFRGILDYETEPIVSSDIRFAEASGTFDSLATMTLGANASKTLTWFDNGWGYAHRLAELVARGAREVAR